MGRIQKLRYRRYEVYRKALERFGVEIDKLKRPNIYSVQNAKKEWRKIKLNLESIGIKVGKVDDVADGKGIPEEDMESLLIVRRVQKIIEEGLSYNSPKASQAGAIKVNATSERLKLMIDEALEKLGVEETAKRLEEWAGENDLYELVERLEYGVYDSEFAQWANGRAAWDSLMDSLAEALEVSDFGKILTD